MTITKNRAGPLGRPQENFTPTTIVQVAEEISIGQASTEDARHLLELFHKNPTPELTAHMRAAIGSYLTGKKTLEAALGLKRRKGHPEADAFEESMLALQVLEIRLTGESHQNAVLDVSERTGTGETKIGKAWKRHKHDARDLLIVRKWMAGSALPDDTIARMDKILTK